MAYKIALLPGDGIGVEVVEATRQVLEALPKRFPSLGFTFEYGDYGYGSWEKNGTGLPEASIELAKQADGCLVGAADAARMPHTGESVSNLRRRLDTYANLRPLRSFEGVDRPFKDVDILVIRENTEGFYSGIEYRVGPRAACAVRIVTHDGSSRVARVAFEQARKRRKRVTTAHKLGALKISDTVHLEACGEVARDYPDVEFETRNIDALTMELVLHPQRFDVILLDNMWGDIISDECAGLVGGLGLAPSACIGDRYAYFEPMHGTGPDIVGQGIANPLATVLTAAMMLEHMQEQAAGAALRDAVATVLRDGRGKTGDLGGKAKTADVVAALVDVLSQPV
ncbi:MAG: isocitrate/isopropylmalate dehydrogenase family protein [Chloroflexi bacterium]|nr:isocitrate/isopropylmalate dehydrogenase family protein [Chloroflexota bacterium]